jgi:hypothetical protein
VAGACEARPVGRLAQELGRVDVARLGVVVLLARRNDDGSRLRVPLRPSRPPRARPCRSHHLRRQAPAARGRPGSYPLCGGDGDHGDPEGGEPHSSIRRYRVHRLQRQVEQRAQHPVEHLGAQRLRVDAVLAQCDERGPHHPSAALATARASSSHSSARVAGWDVRLASMSGSRSGGMIASTWAATLSLGQDSYLRIAVESPPLDFCVTGPKTQPGVTQAVATDLSTMREAICGRLDATHEVGPDELPRGPPAHGVGHGCHRPLVASAARTVHDGTARASGRSGGRHDGW